MSQHVCLDNRGSARANTKIHGGRIAALFGWHIANDSGQGATPGNGTSSGLGRELCLWLGLFLRRWFAILLGILLPEQEKEEGLDVGASYCKVTRINNRMLLTG
jgi:hypothetical protein